MWHLTEEQEELRDRVRDIALAKIRLRHRLGSLALLTGLGEILMLLAMIGFLAWSFGSVAVAADQPTFAKTQTGPMRHLP